MSMFMKQRILSCSYDFDGEYWTELSGYNRYYTGDNIYAYPKIKSSSKIFVRILDVKDVLVGEYLERDENVVEKYLFIDPKLETIDPIKYKNFKIVEFDSRKYDEEYKQKHQEWIKERDAMGAYSDFDDLERY